MVNRIRLLALDIDGVLTDGCVSLGPDAQKRICFHDLDAVASAKRAGLAVALVTGENDRSVDDMAKRFGITLIRRGAKEKLAAVTWLARNLKIGLHEICYVGDSDRDAHALVKVGLGLAPANATPMAKGAAHCVLSSRGGQGAVAEAARLLLQLNADAQSSSGVAKSVRRAMRSASKGNQLLLNRLFPALLQTAILFRRTLLAGRKILVYGNDEEMRILSAQLFAHTMGSGRGWPVLFLGRDLFEGANAGRVARSGDPIIGLVRTWARPGDLIVGLGENNSGAFSKSIDKIAGEREAFAFFLIVNRRLLRTFFKIVVASLGVYDPS